MKQPSIVLAGGGSAGHVSPLLAIAAELRKQVPGAEISVIGTARGLETRLVPAAGFDLSLIEPVPFPRRPSLAALRFIPRFLKARKQAMNVVDAVAADVVVGVGGYVCTPVYLAAKARKVPMVIHEANITVGLANRVGARFTTALAKAFTQCHFPGASWVGMPMRADIASLDRAAERVGARERLGLRQDAPVLVVTGGSLGAVRINERIAALIPEFDARGIQVVHLTGAGKSVLGADGAVLSSENYQQREYLDTMADAYAAADMVICRAGAGTVCEVAATGVPAVFVPLPIGNGEQKFNAATLSDHGAALQVSDAEFSEQWVRLHVFPILEDPGALKTMSERALALGKRDAAELMARLVREQLPAGTIGHLGGSEAEAEQQ